MKQLYLDIKERILSLVPSILHVAVFNNQIELIKNDSKEYENSIYVFPRPAVFIEFESPLEIHQLGNGVQSYDPLVIKIHLLHEFFNGENYEENLDVFDLKMDLYKALQKFEPDGCVAWVRTAEEQDTDHTNLYHFIMSFTTNYIDPAMMEPVNSKTTTDPIALQLSVDLDLVNDPSEDESAE